jgi:hypothetical protein
MYPIISHDFGCATRGVTAVVLRWIGRDSVAPQALDDGSPTRGPGTEHRACCSPRLRDATDEGTDGRRRVRALRRDGSVGESIVRPHKLHDTPRESNLSRYLRF